MLQARRLSLVFQTQNVSPPTSRKLSGDHITELFDTDEDFLAGRDY